MKIHSNGSYVIVVKEIKMCGFQNIMRVLGNLLISDQVRINMVWRTQEVKREKLEYYTNKITQIKLQK